MLEAGSSKITDYKISRFNTYFVTVDVLYSGEFKFLSSESLSALAAVSKFCDSELLLKIRNQDEEIDE